MSEAGSRAPSGGAGGDTDAVAALPHGILLACALAVLAALIHVQAAVDHLDEYAPYVVAFMVLAAGQTGWAVATYRSAGRSLLRTGVAAGGAVVLLWLVSRTVGLPVGPAQDSAEPVGLLGVVATLDELAVTALAVAALRARDATRGAGGRMLIATGLGLIVLSTLVLAGGLHAH